MKCPYKFDESENVHWVKCPYVQYKLYCVIIRYSRVDEMINVKLGVLMHVYNMEINFFPKGHDK